VRRPVAAPRPARVPPTGDRSRSFVSPHGDGSNLTVPPGRSAYLRRSPHVRRHPARLEPHRHPGRLPRRDAAHRLRHPPPHQELGPGPAARPAPTPGPPPGPPGAAWPAAARTRGTSGPAASPAMPSATSPPAANSAAAPPAAPPSTSTTTAPGAAGASPRSASTGRPTNARRTTPGTGGSGWRRNAAAARPTRPASASTSPPGWRTCRRGSDGSPRAWRRAGPPARWSGPPA
jgi:hypothetical protein